jgi:hypothetical protein
MLALSNLMDPLDRGVYQIRVEDMRAKNYYIHDLWSGISIRYGYDLSD